jgi:hypothetical protein
MRCTCSRSPIRSRPPRLSALLAAVLLGGCQRQPAARLEIDPAIAEEIGRIRAIDHHAHPVRVVAAGEQDREFDALPVDNMEPSSDPLYLRPGDAGVIEAWRALFAYPYRDAQQEHTREARAKKQQMMQDKGNGYPAWVLDQMGVDVMIANRVRMGRGIQAPRFLWAPYADTLIFPLNNSKLAEQNSDRKAFFGYEDKLLQRYLQEAGLTRPPATLGEYLSRVVTPTLERHKRGGAIAEKFEAAYLRSLDFAPVDRAAAERIYSQFAGRARSPAPNTKSCRIICSGRSRWSAAGSAWWSTCTRWPAPGATLRWRERIRCCSNPFSTIRG